MTLSRMVLSGFFLIFLAACAGGKRVSESTSPQELGSSVGYVAFRYERMGDREEAMLYLRNVETGDQYRFSLDRTPNSMYFALGPMKVYEKRFGDTTTSSLVVVPLPAGEYACQSLRVKVEYPGWMAFLHQRNEAVRYFPLKGAPLSVAADTVTYIGTYRTKSKVRFFSGVDYRVETIDDGDQRAAEKGITAPFRKRLLPLE